MNEKEISSLLEAQRKFFRSGATLSVSFRTEQLKKLRCAVKKHEKDICEALHADLGKSDYESYMCEIGLALTEISYMIKNAKRLSAEKRVHTPISQFHSKSYKISEPYGNVLIMSPWNYPFLLSIEPLADAIAAGNTAVVKPSAYSPETSRIISDIIGECFSPEYVATVSGGRLENAALLEERFDMIFFTGSQTVGKEVLRHAAENLTPAVLELGGKSPCIVDGSADIELAARRIVFGKYLNCGQTCVAPDYILCEASVKESFIREVIKQIREQYGEEPLKNENYGRIVNEKHFNRLIGLIEREKLVFGGEYDAETLKIAPAVMDGVTFDDRIMGEEIFGPIMPIITFDSLDGVIDGLKAKEKPLALYIFSRNKRNIKRVTGEVSYGGGCVNDCVIHLATSEMGFGGVGESGMGSYHGSAGFSAFSHEKSIVDKKTWIDLPMRYAPYKSRIYRKLLRFFLK